MLVPLPRLRLRIVTVALLLGASGVAAQLVLAGGRVMDPESGSDAVADLAQGRQPGPSRSSTRGAALLPPPPGC